MPLNSSFEKNKGKPSDTVPKSKADKLSDQSPLQKIQEVAAKLVADQIYFATSGSLKKRADSSEKEIDGTETIKIHEGFNHTTMRSARKEWGPLLRGGKPIVDEKTGEIKKITLCSRTAKTNLYRILKPRKTGYHFVSINPKNMMADIERVISDIKTGKYSLSDVVPMGDAHRVKRFYETIEAYSNKPLIRGTAKEMIQQLNDSGKTVCDILKSGGAKFGHRAVGFKSDIDEHWYVLDPYQSNSTKPIRFEQYIEKSKLKTNFVVPIDTSRLAEYLKNKKGRKSGLRRGSS